MTSWKMQHLIIIIDNYDNWNDDAIKVRIRNFRFSVPRLSLKIREVEHKDKYVL